MRYSISYPLSSIPRVRFAAQAFTIQHSKYHQSTGKGTTFYSWLGVSELAKNPEITKAYRKKSLILQCVSFDEHFDA